MYNVHCTLYTIALYMFVWCILYVKWEFEIWRRDSHNLVFRSINSKLWNIFEQTFIDIVFVYIFFDASIVLATITFFPLPLCFIFWMVSSHSHLKHIEIINCWKSELSCWIDGTASFFLVWPRENKSIFTIISTNHWKKKTYNAIQLRCWTISVEFFECKIKM